MSVSLGLLDYMPLQPELKEKALRQVSSMYLSLKKLQRKPEPTER
jgi:hypothetical protein